MAAVPTELLGSKLLKKIEKVIGKERAAEILEMEDEKLKTMMGECAVREEELKVEVKENPEYRKAKDVTDTFKGGLKDTMKPVKAVSSLAKAVYQARHS